MKNSKLFYPPSQKTMGLPVDECEKLLRRDVRPHGQARNFRTDNPQRFDSRSESAGGKFRKGPRACLWGFHFVLILSLLFSVPAFGTSNYTVDLTTDPVASNIGPDRDTVHVTLTAKDGQGNIVPGAYIKIHMYAPLRNAFISTDFPWVENTHLMEYEGYLSNGVLAFDYIFPIRGQYRIDVQAGADAASLSEKKSLHLSLNENKVEVRNIWIFISILLGFGILAGFIISRGAKGRVREAVIATLAIFLTLGFTYFPSNAYAQHEHQAMNASNVPSFEEQASANGMTLSFAMNPGAGKVGMINDLTFSVKDAAGQPVPNTVFEVAFWHIEDDKPIFSTQLFGKQGSANLDFQFFDGAEHEVRVTASNAAGKVQLTRTVEVEAIHPPMPVKVKTLLYFIFIAFIGILIGFRLQAAPRLKMS